MGLLFIIALCSSFIFCYTAQDKNTKLNDASLIIFLASILIVLFLNF